MMFPHLMSRWDCWEDRALLNMWNRKGASSRFFFNSVAFCTLFCEVHENCFKQNHTILAVALQRYICRKLIKRRLLKLALYQLIAGQSWCLWGCGTGDSGTPLWDEHSSKGSLHTSTFSLGCDFILTCSLSPGPESAFRIPPVSL